MRIRTGLGLYKLYNFTLKYITLLFKPTYDYFKSIIYLLIINFLKSKKKPIFKSKVFLIGSGPSLDEIELEKINNSTVILLNNSWQIYKKLNDNNQIFFASSDCVGTLNLISDDLPKNLNKIICLSQIELNFKSLKLILNLKKTDYLYVGELKTIFSKKISGVAFRSVSNVNKYGFFIIPFYNFKKLSIIKNVWISPYTVMLTMALFSSNCGAREIFSCGFDASNHKVLKYSDLLNIQKYKQKYNNLDKQLDEDTLKNLQITRIIKINLWSRHLNFYLKKRGVRWENLSTQSNISALSSINPKDFKY